MGLFGKRSNAPSKVLRAAGTRISANNRSAVQDLLRTRDQWQTYAWGYRDAIGEVRLGVQFLSWSAAKVRWMAAEVDPASDDPTPIPGAKPADLSIDARLAKDAQAELERLPLDAGYSFWGVMAENLKIAGECWLHGFMNDEGVETWRVRSVDEIVPDAGGGLGVREHPDRIARRVNLKEEELIRLWVPHPRWREQPDSPMRSLLDACEDLVLIGRELRAAARSRIAANGILKVPNSLSLRKNTSGDSNTSDAFMQELTESLLAPISNEGDPGGVAPVVITGDLDDLEGLSHLTIAREDSPELLKKAEAALGRVVRGLDIPPEYITGMGDANHWSAWAIDATTFRQYIDPVVQLVCDSLTEGYLRPALREMGYDNDQVAKVQVWRDAGAITENPNRVSDAKDAFDRGGISWQALRDALGFSDDDAPDEEELQRIIAVKSGVDMGTAAQLLGMIAGASQPQPRVIEAEPATPGQQAPADQEPGTEDEAIPQTASIRALVAAITDPTTGWTVLDDLATELADIDHELRMRILQAVEDATDRALEKAGARTRTAAHNANQKAKQELYDTSVDVMALTTHLGRDTITELGLDDENLLRDAYQQLRSRILGWIHSAAKAAARALARRLNTDPQPLEDTYTGTIGMRYDRAWATLHQRLLDHASNLLYQPDPDKGEGELPDLKTPVQPIRAIIADTLGSTDNEGLTGGPTTDILTGNGAANLGFQWRYGPTPRENTYQPHLQLNGKRFSSFDDPALNTPPEQSWIGARFRPGDHKGCLCDYMPIWAIPEADEILRERLGEESEGTRATRLLAELDDAAGRQGTTAQRGRDQRAAILELQRRYIQSE